MSSTLSFHNSTTNSCFLSTRTLTSQMTLALLPSTLPLHVLSSHRPLLTSSSLLRFKTLTTDTELEEAKEKAVPKNTDKNTSWALNVWNEWSAHRCQMCSSHNDWPTHQMIAHPTELDYWLSKFVLETRKANGERYPLDTLYSLCNGLLRYIQETRLEINIFKDPVLSGFQCTLDSEMKH